ncbi:N-6 DNA methylase [Exiguobacterium sp. s168]|uniref:N-6 DNA methylase n=1 Tax=Exiguobacterium sp. s168 TaxID=2751194 RepID=UPI001BE5FF38|nr:N-6 DNA methylase [Exiguobacterium sp. s168]
MPRSHEELLLTEIEFFHSRLRRYFEPEDIIAYTLSLFSIQYHTLQHPQSKVNLSRVLNVVALDQADTLTQVFKQMRLETSLPEELYTALEIDWHLLNPETLNELVERTSQMSLSYFPTIVESLFQYEVHQPGNSLLDHSTPLFLRRLMTRLLQVLPGASVYDGTAGFAGNLRSVLDQGLSTVSIYGEEIHPKIWAIGKLSLFFYTSHISAISFKQSDVLLHPAYQERNQLQQFDRILTTPPANLRMMEYTASILAQDEWDRFPYGELPRKHLDFAFIQHSIATLKSTGRAVLLVSNGALYRDGKERLIREQLIEMDLVETVITFPAYIMHGFSDPVSIVVIDKQKDTSRKDKIQFIDATNWIPLTYAKTEDLEQDLNKMMEITIHPEKHTSFARLVPKSDIQSGNLIPSTYLENESIQIDKDEYQLDFTKLESKDFITLNQLGKVFSGLNTTSKNAVETSPDMTSYRLIQLKDVYDDRLHLEELKSIEIHQRSIERYILQEGDVIINARGLPTRIAVVPPHDQTLILSQNFIGFRPNKNSLSPYFLKFYLESPIGQYYLYRALSTNTTTILLPKLLQNVLCPVLPLSLQHVYSKNYYGALETYYTQVESAKQTLRQARQQFYDDIHISTAFSKRD